MSRLVTFFALTGSDRLLLLKAVATVAALRLALPLVRPERLRRWAAHGGTGSRPIARIAWAVRAAVRALPGTTCLPAALAMQRLLSASGHACELHVGVAKRGDALEAHAWVVCNGEVLVGEHERDEYTRLMAWQAGTPDTA
jgi:hypothetical protein